MQSTAIYDAAIIGAGPAGSALAAVLAGRGWRVLLIERDDFPRHKVCGEFLSPEAQDTLARFGLVTAVAALEPVPLTKVALFTARGRVLRRPLSGCAWGVSRYGLDQALASAAQRRGVELWTRTTASHLERQGEAMRVRVRRAGWGGWLQARTVILAYGRHGPPGIDGAGRRAGRPAPRYVGVKRHLTGLALPPQVSLYFFPGGYAGLSPVEGGYANFCLLATYAAFARAGRTVQGMFEAAAASNGPLAAQLAGAQPVAGADCVVGAVDTDRPAQPWQGAARLGDAAVMLPPLCGDGMAMALRSAELCAPLADAYLRGQLSEAAWAAAYRRAWQAEFGRRVWLGRWFQRALQRPAWADGLLTIGGWFPWLADYAVAATRGKPSPVAPPSWAAWG